MGIRGVTGIWGSAASSRTRRRLAASCAAGACLFGVSVASAHVSFTDLDAGSTFLAGSTVELKWVDAIPHQTEAYHLEFHPGEGQGVVIVASDIPATEHSFQWPVPSEPCADCSLVVIQDNAAADYSATREIAIVLTAEEIPAADDAAPDQSAVDDSSSADNSATDVDDDSTDDTMNDDATESDADDVEPSGVNDGEDSALRDDATLGDPMSDDDATVEDGATTGDSTTDGDVAPGATDDASENISDDATASGVGNVQPTATPSQTGASAMATTPTGSPAAPGMPAMVGGPDTMQTGRLESPAGSPDGSSESEGLGCSLGPKRPLTPAKDAALAGLLGALALCVRRTRR